ncbi:hypothetical protein CCM_06655 [Cordyceps militaris CM01]|uniref:Uncharacterized protein n=2 Tax=Cordyceps militaris TaxID=73501 RepID=G3JN54_CORMM|nr:uncharacterized protein CCM_06655 [Cordyceps militaris CM01]ATY62941.1 hypothetical protein A9K55_008245 [Cordyceps militaris]EGX90236.1 hypothetical protein CCM_06655 [Cordyceps militaris CM01]
MMHKAIISCLLLLSTVQAQPVDTGSRNLLFRGRMAISDSPIRSAHDAYKPETSAANKDEILGRDTS